MGVQLHTFINICKNTAVSLRDDNELLPTQDDSDNNSDDHLFGCFPELVLFHGAHRAQ